MKRLNAQIGVLGGGPAGASAARRLAMMGHSVVLIEKSPFPRAHIGESLIGSVLPLLDVLQLRKEVEQEDFLRTGTALIRWTGATEYRETAGQSGFQVDRSRFDTVVLQGARDAGVQILQPARAIDISTNSKSLCTVVVRQADNSVVQVDCEFIVDASGRTSVLGGRKNLPAARTIALYAYWKGIAVAGPETRVEAGQSEWFWGAPLPQGLFNATVFVESDRYRKDNAEAGSVDRFYERLIASSELLSPCLIGGRIGKVRVCDATCISDDAPIAGRVIKIGEASFAIDPLSSQGVQTAIGSALHAAAVLHTILERPSDDAIARQFYRERQRRSVILHADAAALLYAEAAAVYRTGFWLRRSAVEVQRHPATRPPPTVAPKPETVVRIHPGVSFKQVPVIEGTYVIAAKAVTLLDHDEPVVFLDGVRFVPLIEMLRGPMRCGDILQLWTLLVPYQQALRILFASVRLGILCPDAVRW